MGFMAGVGEGFSRSFEAGQQRTHERRQDAFRIAYDSYTRKKADYDSENKAWQSALKSGQAIVSQFPNVPKEAALKAAEFLMAGFTVADVEEKIRTSTFTTKPDTVDTMGMTAGITGTPIDTQMQDSGLAPPKAPMPAQQPDPLEQALGPDNMASIRGMFPNAGKSDIERAEGSVREAVGGDFDTVNQGFTQPVDTSGIQMTAASTTTNPLDEFGIELGEGISDDKIKTVDANASVWRQSSDPALKAKAARWDALKPSLTTTPTELSPLAEFGLDDGVTDAKYRTAVVNASAWAKSKDPELVAKAARFNALKPEIETSMRDDITPEQKAAVLELLKPTQSIRWEIMQAGSAAITVAEQGKALADMVEKNEAILTTSAAGASLFEAGKTELATIFDIIGKLGSEGKSEQDVIAAIEQQTATLSSKASTPELARQYREFSAAAVRYIYAVGKALGQQGNGFSNADYNNIRTSVLTSNNKEAFIANLKRLAQERFSAVNNDITNLAIFPDVAGLLATPELAPALSASMRPLEKQYAHKKEIIDWMNEKEGPSTDPMGLDIGTREIDDEGNEYEYLGGDPKQESSWKKLPANPAR